ncbi:MAG: hypothetical protein EA415_01715 [Sphaerobacteraceae bacterium]|nr:MAG: hypothetical protein EA415_01715 [Sphaerobacteraceae bacterium]
MGSSQYDQLLHVASISESICYLSACLARPWFNPEGFQERFALVMDDQDPFAANETAVLPCAAIGTSVSAMIGRRLLSGFQHRLSIAQQMA